MVVEVAVIKDVCSRCSSKSVSSSFSKSMTSSSSSSNNSRKGTHNRSSCSTCKKKRQIVSKVVSVVLEGEVVVKMEVLGRSSSSSISDGKSSGCSSGSFSNKSSIWISKSSHRS